MDFVVLPEGEKSCSGDAVNSRERFDDSKESPAARLNMSLEELLVSHANFQICQMVAL